MSGLWGSVRLTERPMNTPKKVADSLHYRLEAPKIEFPLFINKTRLRE
jgi:hypothetical protein